MSNIHITHHSTAGKSINAKADNTYLKEDDSNFSSFKTNIWLHMLLTTHITRKVQQELYSFWHWEQFVGSCFYAMIFSCLNKRWKRGKTLRILCSFSRLWLAGLCVMEMPGETDTVLRYDLALFCLATHTGRLEQLAFFKTLGSLGRTY